MGHSSVKDEVAGHTKRVIEDATYSAKSHFNASDIWAGYNSWLAIPNILLALLAGGTAIQEWPLAASVSAFAAAALSGILTFLNPQDRSYSHRRAADQYLALKNRALLLLNVDLKLLDESQASRQIEALSRERDALNHLSPSIPARAYRRAKQGIEGGENIYEVDQQAAK